MTSLSASARSCSNIAFIKYWGNRDDALRLPANGSISMNLAGIETITRVEFRQELEVDQFILNGALADAAATRRVSAHLDHLRKIAGTAVKARVSSTNNFPTGAGIASSASAFSALTVAAAKALGLDLEEAELSYMARLGSGSACRSIPSGFVEWRPGLDHVSSYAVSIAPPEHWDLVDLVAIVSTAHKEVGSTGGHALAPTSPLQDARVRDAERRLDECRRAILERDFKAFAPIIELDALMMHAVMMTSQPALIYWLPETLQLINAVRAWRGEGLDVAFTIDAGPNVHVMATAANCLEVEARLKQQPGVINVLKARPGAGAHAVQA